MQSGETRNATRVCRVEPAILRRSNLSFTLWLVLLFTSVAQAQLSLRLQAAAYQDGVPSLFKATLVNHTDAVLHLPRPRPFCSAFPGGGILLVATFHSPDARLGYFGPACAEATDVATLQWVELRPLQALTIDLDTRGRGWITPRGSGCWKVHAIYQPPSLSDNEQRWLKDHQQKYPIFTAESAQLIFPTTSRSSLQLRIQSAKSQNGLPTSLLAKLTNTGKYAVHLPRPVFQCTDDYNGFLTLSIAFKPAAVPLASGSGRGCGGGGYDAARGARRIQQWLTLDPNESLHFSIALRGWMTDQGSGSYDISLTYRPPVMSSDEQQLLVNRRVLYPDSDVVSNHVVIRR